MAPEMAKQLKTLVLTAFEKCGAGRPNIEALGC